MTQDGNDVVLADVRPTLQLRKVEGVPQLLDMLTLAELLSTSERHLRRLVAERRIPFIRVGRFIRFEPEAIATWLSERATDAVS